MQRLKVLSFNIWHREAPWEARRELIRRGVAQLAPDLVGFQEVLSLTMANGRQNQADELCHGTPYSYVFGRAQTLGPGFEFGNALASRHPILEHEVFALPGEESGETRSVLYALVDSPYGEVPVFVTHLNWKLQHGSIRCQQIKRITKIMNERAPTGSHFPALLLGDMNDSPHAVTTQMIAATLAVAYDRGARDTALYHAWDVATEPAIRRDVGYSHVHQGWPELLDQIWVSEEFVATSKHAIGDVRRVEVFNDHLHESRERWRSDHGFVRALLRLKGTAP